MTKEEFCKRLKDINLTQKEFSEITNVPYSTLNNWCQVESSFFKK